MTCDHCVAAVREEIGNLDAVQEVHVDLVPGGTSRVTVTSTTAVPDDQVRAAVESRPATRWRSARGERACVRIVRAWRTAAATSTVDLPIGGMTCASCAARIEKKLNRIDGRDGHGQLRDREGARQLPAGT